MRIEQEVYDNLVRTPLSLILRVVPWRVLSIVVCIVIGLEILWPPSVSIRVLLVEKCLSGTAS